MEMNESNKKAIEFAGVLQDTKAIMQLAEVLDGINKTNVELFKLVQEQRDYFNSGKFQTEVKNLMDLNAVNVSQIIEKHILSELEKKIRDTLKEEILNDTKKVIDKEVKETIRSVIDSNMDSIKLRLEENMSSARKELFKKFKDELDKVKASLLVKIALISITISTILGLASVIYNMFKLQQFEEVIKRLLK